MFIRFSASGTVLLGLVGLVSSTQVPLASYHISPDDHEVGKPIITDEFSSEVLKILEKSGVQGTSVAIVRPDGEVELGAFGNRSEKGESTEPSACLFSKDAIRD